MQAGASVQNNQLGVLSRRAGYNLALRHFRTTQEFADGVADGYNLADLLNPALADLRIEDFQIRPVLSILLSEKFRYAYASENLRRRVLSVSNLNKVVATWTGIQVVLVYTDTNGGVHPLNPEVLEPWEAVLPLDKDEHITCYAGSLDDVESSVLNTAVEDVFKLLYGARIKGKPAYKSATRLKRFLEIEAEAPAPAMPVDEPSAAHPPSVPPPSPPSGGGLKRITAKIAVNVTNELFHNGNVEAWKRIIESYLFKYPALDVLIWYEGERINDINALFKWGKVKHGVPIMFSVAGENPLEVSKLRKYLFEGASPRFEAFLHGAPGTILKLF